MSTDTETETTGAAAEAAAVPLDLLLTDAVLGALRRVNPGGSGVRLAAALATRPRLVGGRGGNCSAGAARARLIPAAGMT